MEKAVGVWGVGLCPQHLVKGKDQQLDSLIVKAKLSKGTQPLLAESLGRYQQGTA